MDRVLITGGAGFIGSYLVRAFIEKHPEDIVLNVDKLTYAADLHRLSKVENHPNYRFIQADIASYDDMQGIIDDFAPTLIINVAAESHVDKSIDCISPFLHTNIHGVTNLLNCIADKKDVHFVQVSTDEVYGPNHNNIPFVETDARRPQNPYAATKASAEMIVESFSNTYGIKTTITRGCNTYGTDQHCEKLIPKMIALAKANQSLPIYGDGKQTREWLSVHDHVKAIAFLAKNRQVGTYNIGSGIIRTNMEVVSCILDLCKLSSSGIVHMEDRLGHDRAYGINSQKLRNLGWSSDREFEAELKRIVSIMGA
ncbi:MULTISPECIES: dTDP-glucose 4,6-dehydratase [unclassified Fusibacter]|uniref:dTDP-glucose 4,6-dehydratase n=1 Tax=unclassified Fusibacter TaxID=2624464 RepID=UPI001011864E|nr:MULTISPECIES: GDP-mannose 4,6-dehydratase [unclassified Fusibacter]MCK8058191.1 GDP-mannose 4,6-dehydratase [Fusibacter sp. A2]NPE20774.1 NAD-dependent epimerase/dehydratase family protein [Fusibacter sp. A1]RXV62980.1 NAD-dependent epimerase/dehydratase family protein [Fusibacter sp. A1]